LPSLGDVKLPPAGIYHAILVGMDAPMASLR
jgi:hypothetical protein